LQRQEQQTKSGSPQGTLDQIIDWGSDLMFFASSSFSCGSSSVCSECHSSSAIGSGAMRLNHGKGPLHIVLGDLQLDTTDSRAKVPGHPHNRLVGKEGAYAVSFEMIPNNTRLG
jgi:hypothetical protein